MITSLSIGTAWHKPNGETLYPIYYKSDAGNQTAYIPKQGIDQIKNVFDFIFTCMEKGIYDFSVMI